MYLHVNINHLGLSCRILDKLCTRLTKKCYFTTQKKGILRNGHFFLLQLKLEKNTKGCTSPYLPIKFKVSFASRVLLYYYLHFSDANKNLLEKSKMSFHFLHIFDILNNRKIILILKTYKQYFEMPFMYIMKISNTNKKDCLCIFFVIVTSLWTLICSVGWLVCYNFLKRQR